MSAHVNISPADRADMVAMRNRGVTLAEIGRTYRVTPQSVSYHLAKALPEPVVDTPADEQPTSLRVAILRRLATFGDYSSARSLLTAISSSDPDRWRGTGLHSLQHLLHTLTKQGFISTNVSAIGSQKQISDIKLIQKGADFLWALDHPATSDLVLTSLDHQVNPFALVEAEASVALDHGHNGAYTAKPSALVGEDVLPVDLVAENGDSLVVSMVDGVAIDAWVEKRHASRRASDQSSGLTGDADRPFAFSDVARFPVLTFLRNRVLDGVVAKAKADKYIEAAILLEDVDPEMTTALQKTAESIAQSYTLTAIEAEYLDFAGPVGKERIE